MHHCISRQSQHEMNVVRMPLPGSKHQGSGVHTASRTRWRISLIRFRRCCSFVVLANANVGAVLDFHQVAILAHVEALIMLATVAHALCPLELRIAVPLPLHATLNG